MVFHILIRRAVTFFISDMLVQYSDNYYHFKHDPKGPVNNMAYEVVGVCIHTEGDARPGEENFIAYRPLYDCDLYEASKKLHIPLFYNRPFHMWEEEIERNGKRMKIFQKITDETVIVELEKISQKMYTV